MIDAGPTVKSCAISLIPFRSSRQPLRAPNDQLLLVFCKIIVLRVVQCCPRTVICAEMAKTAPDVPVLGKSLVRILWIHAVVCNMHHRDAFLRTDPCAYSAARAPIHVEEMPSSVPVWEFVSLVRMLQSEGSLEDVFHAFQECLGCFRRLHLLPVCLYGPVIQASIDYRHVTYPNSLQ